ncbi:MAG: peptidoglycan bridge formation glycyltransferase FemA/FemB family protein [Candidatus Magasanikbacteria bacterium]|nr:peptidoglycan bridge formation glycyltransferase FemA/FemB family protein [Candidatus Magasanikbacteria bacterium]
MFDVREIKDEKIWEKFIIDQTYAIFLQSPQYGEFYKKLGEQSWVFGIFDAEKLVGGTLAVTVHAKRGSFLFLPYGPVISEKKNRGEALKALTAHLSNFARSQKLDFIKSSPFWENNPTNQNLFKQFKYQNAPMHILAENTWLLDLSLSEENLLAGMEKTHRYLIRRCMKTGVIVIKTNEPQKLAEFSQLHDLTAQRHKFHRFSDEYIQNEYNCFAPRGEAMLIKGILPDGRVDSAAVVIFYGNMAAYRHGASANFDHKLPTSYLVQWEAIKEAKKRGLSWYNFWGITPPNANKKHPFYGITHFKKGFGGFNFNLVHCQDLPLTKKYYLNWLVETFRSLRRGFK